VLRCDPRAHDGLRRGSRVRVAGGTLHERFEGLDRRPLADDLTLIVASTRRSRMRGLAGLGALPAGYGLLLSPCRSIHTLAMRFALDLVWLDRDGAPLRLDENVAPRRQRSCLRARSVIETNAGEGRRFQAVLAAGKPPG